MANPLSNPSVTVSEDQVSCDLAGEIAILNLKNGVYYGLDDVGARIWHLLQQPTHIDEIVRVILQEYDVEESRVRADLAGLLATLRKEGLIDLAEGAAES